MTYFTTRGAACNGSALLRYSRALLLLAITASLVSCGGGSDGGGAGGQGALACSVSGKAPAVLTWDPVTGSDGYHIYYDTAAGMGANPQMVNVVGTNVTTTQVTMAMGLSSGTTYYFAATAYDSMGAESGLSNVVCKTITS